MPLPGPPAPYVLFTITIVLSYWPGYVAANLTPERSREWGAVDRSPNRFFQPKIGSFQAIKMKFSIPVVR